MSIPNYEIVLNVGTLSTFASIFKFYLSGSDEIIGVNTSSTSFGGFTTITSLTDARKNFIEELCKHIFGSSKALFLSNTTNCVTAWNNATNSSLTSLNNLVINNNEDASYELVDSILTNNPERFELKYNATTSNFPTGTTNDGTISTNGSGSGATISVIMSNSTSISSLTILNSGSNYSEGDSLTITHNSDTISISSLNSTQVARLNGSLYDSNTPTNVPLEVGDKLRVKYTIQSATSQTDVTGDGINITNDFYIDYEVN